VNSLLRATDLNNPSVEKRAAHCQDSPRPRLRLGVVLDSYQVPGWIYYLLGKLSSSEVIDLCLLVLDEGSKPTAEANRPPVLLRLWNAMDRWFRRSAADALQIQDCGKLLRSGRSTPGVLRMNLDGTLGSCELATIQIVKPDLLLHLGHGTLPPEAIACAELGAWLLQEDESRDGTAGQLWDMYDGNAVFAHGPQLVEQTRTGTRTLHRSHGITSFLSLALNQNAAYWNLAEFLVRELSDVSRLRAETEKSAAASAVRQVSGSRSLSGARAADFVMRWAVRTVRHQLQKHLFREQWSMVLQPASETKEFKADGICRRIQPPADRFYADPFLIERNGRTYLFFEDYRFATGKGLISCCELVGAGNCGAMKVVLECEYHLSYPFLFEWQGEIYMIPETRDNRTIEMYRANDFPCSWVREAVLMHDIAAVDTTLLQYQGKWWMFTAGVHDNASPADELFLYFADSPLGPWTAHPKNPVVSDPRRARPAGCLYLKNGKLIRPGQDSSRGYGYAIQLHQVDVLSETDYQETPLTRMTPRLISGSLGTHTFNRSAKFQVIDARFLISRFQFVPFRSRRPAAKERDEGVLYVAADRLSRDATDGTANRFVREAGRNSR
jgi:hypothetical protein